MAWLRVVGIGVAVVLAATVLILAVFSVLARRPENLGVVDGRLADCPATPNCVCTQGGNPEQQMPPIAFTGDPSAAVVRLQAVLHALPRTKIVTVKDNYLHAECTSAIFQFVDDVEFLIDPEQRVIHFRSASRAGRSDMGVNRERMEAIRKAFTEN